MGREVGGRFWMGNTCTPVGDPCQCMAKPLQYCKVIHLQLKSINLLKNKNKCPPIFKVMLIVKPLTKSECFVSCLVFLKINILQMLKKKMSRF